MVKAPEYFTGDVVGRLNAKRARILGIEPAGKDLNVIRALTPLGELVRFTTELRSITQGRGAFHMKFDSYKEMPAPTGRKADRGTQAKKIKDNFACSIEVEAFDYKFALMEQSCLFTKNNLT